MLQNFFMGVHGADGIRVHPVDDHLREQSFQLLLHLLCAGAHGLHRAAALGTALGGGLGKAAVVAHQPSVGAVVGQGHGAAGALRGFPTVHAQKETTVAPTVQQQHRLIPPVPVVVDGLTKGVAEGKVVSQLHFLPHIHDLDLRKGPSVVAFF